MTTDKKISPQAISALKDALSIIFWKKENLQDFVKLALENNAIVGTINWNVTKRESVKELIDRLLNRPDIYKNELLNLLLAVTDFEDFGNLTYWDDDGTKTKKAKEAVSRLREFTKGYIIKTQEQEDAKTRKKEFDKKTLQSKSLQDELNKLNKEFIILSSNKNVQERGYQLEKFLYDLFLLYDLEPKGSFKIYGEQIDGAFTFQGSDYLLEAKWKSQVNMGEIASFCHKVETKFKTAVGLLVTINGVTSEAISPHFKSIIIMDGADIIAVLDGRISLTDLLFKKRRKAIETGNIYLSITDL